MLKTIPAVLLSFCVITASVISTVPVQSQSGDAVIVAMHNDVQAKTEEKKIWHLTHLNKGLEAGDSIRTGKASRVEIKYNDGTITRVGANSLIRIQEKGQKRSHIRLLLGKLWMKVTKSDEKLKVETPTAIASILGTELFVSNNADNVSHVTTVDGLVQVDTLSGESTLVRAGEWVEIEPGKPLEKPTKFDWAALRVNERFLLDPDFTPSPDDFEEEDNWK